MTHPVTNATAVSATEEGHLDASSESLNPYHIAYRIYLGSDAVAIH
jgi:hypothetical protein